MLKILNDSGSGSTYVYGYCDATFKEGWGRDETVEFVKNSEVFPNPFISACLTIVLPHIALALAMSRDGSSGGVIRMCVITEDGVERLFVPGNQLPKFWEGYALSGTTKKPQVEPEVIPMTIEV